MLSSMLTKPTKKKNKKKNNKYSPSLASKMFSYSINHTFEYPWEVVVKAFWQKYPHPNLPHIRESLILSREYDSDSGVLKTKRLMCVEQKVPRSLLMFVKGADRFYAIEETTIDSNNREMYLTTKNLSFSRILDATSVASYVASRETDEEKTNYSVEATVKILTLPKIVSNRVANFLGTSSHKNANLGILAMEDLCKQIMKEIW